MRSNYQVYRSAASLVRQGWLRGDFIDPQGNQCLVQSVLTAARIPGRTLPHSMVTEIDERLQHYPSYRVIRAATLRAHEEDLKAWGAPVGARDAILQGVIMRWNDLMWRRQGTVAQVLESIASDLAEQEIERLTAEVSRLQAVNEELLKRIASLETENQRLWARLTNFFTLRADRAELEHISEELEKHWQELTALKA